MSTDTDLRTRLHDLADDAPVGGLAAGDIWRSGVRRHRLRLAGSSVAAAVVVVALVVGLGAVVGQPSSHPAPADVPFGELAIPRTVYPPDPWADGTNELGPPGPLAAIDSSLRTRANGLWGESSRQQLFGVSAVDGSARFIDLPEERGTFVEPLQDTVALSPDGSEIAMARFRGVPGEPRGVVGWDVYDTITGDITQLRVPGTDAIPAGGSAAGLRQFSGDSQYLMTEFSVGDQERGDGEAVVVWDLATGKHRVVTGSDSVRWLGSAPAGFAWSDGKRLVTHYDPGTDMSTTNHPGPGSMGDVALADDYGAYAFIVRGNDPGLFVKETGRTPAEVALKGLRPDEIVAWAGPDALVLTAGSRTLRVDVSSGAVELIRLRQADSQAMTPHYATDLFANPLVDGRVQPDAQDPRLWLRWWSWACGGGLLLALAGLALWRRRGRP